MVYTTVDTHQVIKALVTCSTFRRFNSRNSLNDSSSYAQSVQHLTLCITWVNITSLHSERSTAGIEVLEFKFTLTAAINSICPIATEKRYIEIVCTTANLLIGIECNAYFSALRDLVMIYPVGYM